MLCIISHLSDLIYLCSDIVNFCCYTCVFITTSYDTCIYCRLNYPICKLR